MIDITLEIVRALVLLGIVIFLWTVGRGRIELARTGWNFIIGGFGLLLFGSLVDITDNFASLNRYVVIGDTEVEAFLEKFVGFLGGFILLAIGLVRWIPRIQRLSEEVAQRKRVENALQDSEAKFRDFAVSSSDWLWEMDEDLRFTYFSDRFTDITGVPQAALLGKTQQESGIPDVAEEAWRQHLADLAAHRPFREFRHPREHPERGTVFLSINGKPVFDEAGKFCGYRGTGGDITERKRTENALRTAHDMLERRVRERTVALEREITERKRAEEALLASEHALQERVVDLEEVQLKLETQGEDLVRLADDLLFARDEARAADRAKSEFLASMSHELRTPLNAVIGFSEVIKNETFGPVGSTQYREYGSDIYESGLHLLGLINDILDLSKIESGTDELYEDKIEIPKIVRAALKLVGHRAEQGGVTLELDLSDQLSVLRGDERKLKQILVNLLSNAVKFTDAGGKVTLSTWCRMDSGHVFQIVDTGIGIASEDIPKALSRFGQVDSDLSRQYEGTGLGLPLTKALVEQHGGTLELQSEVGVGTTVTVRFPAERIVVSLDNSDSLDLEDGAAG